MFFFLKPKLITFSYDKYINNIISKLNFFYKFSQNISYSFLNILKWDPYFSILNDDNVLEKEDASLFLQQEKNLTTLNSDHLPEVSSYDVLSLNLNQACYC